MLVTFAILLLPFSVFTLQNNVCKTFNDYKTLKTNTNCWHNPNVGATPEEVVKHYGFPFETHRLETSDGFVLKMFRVSNRNGRPLVLHHGLAGDSLSWIMEGNNSLVLDLARNGYDVWILNIRGSKFSSQNKLYTPYEKKYWDFSFHEVGTEDVPRIIEYVAEETQKKGEIVLIGHSMGGTIAKIYASTKTDHARDNLKMIVALASTAYLHHGKAQGFALIPFIEFIKKILERFNIYGFGKNIQFFHDTFHRVCSSALFIESCSILTFLNAGLNAKKVNPEFISLLWSSYPEGFSTKCFYHYAQIVAAGKGFPLYNYGEEENLKIYNATFPPEYPVEKITTPMHLFYGSNDFFSVEEDNIFFFNKLQTKKSITRCADLVHHDFLLAESKEFRLKLLDLLAKAK